MNNREEDLKIFINNFKKNCSKVIVKSFEKGELITTYIKNRNQICLLETGNAQIIRYLENGSSEVIDSLKPNSVFGEVFYRIAQNNELVVIAKLRSTVLFFDYNFLFYPCALNCQFHNEITENFSFLIMEKMANNSQRIELLAKKTIREKLISFFERSAAIAFSNTFTLPMSYSDLADYLCVNRSALMRELKYLEEEHIIIRKNKMITLVKN